MRISDWSSDVCSSDLHIAESRSWRHQTTVRTRKGNRMSISLNGKPALIVNECQLGVIDARYTGFPGLAEQVEARGIVQRIARLAEAFRSRGLPVIHRSEEHTSELQSLMRISYAVFC